MADPEHAGHTASLGWPGNVFKSGKSWARWQRRRRIENLYRDCCSSVLNPKHAEDKRWMEGWRNDVLCFLSLCRNGISKHAYLHPSQAKAIRLDVFTFLEVFFQALHLQQERAADSKGRRR